MYILDILDMISCILYTLMCRKIVILDFYFVGIRFVTLLQGTYFSTPHPHYGGCGICPQKAKFEKLILAVRLIIDSEAFVI